MENNKSLSEESRSVSMLYVKVPSKEAIANELTNDSEFIQKVIEGIDAGSGGSSISPNVITELTQRIEELEKCACVDPNAIQEIEKRINKLEDSVNSILYPPLEVTIEPWERTIDLNSALNVGDFSIDSVPEGMTIDASKIVTMDDIDNNSEAVDKIFDIPVTINGKQSKVRLIWKGMYPTIYRVSGTDVTQPLGGDYSGRIDWGDGIIEEVTGVSSATHTYSDSGEHDIKILNKPLFDKISSSNLIQVGSSVKSVSSFSSNLSQIPEDLLRYGVSIEDLSNLFYACSELTSIPSGLFDNCPNVTSFYCTFFACLKLTSIPSGLFDYCPNVNSFKYTFAGYTGLRSIPSGLFDNCKSVTDFDSTFANCRYLTTIPSGLFNNCTNVTSFHQVFFGCVTLKNIPSGLFNNCTNVTSFANAFNNCDILAGESVKVTLKDGTICKLWELAGKPGYPDTIDGEWCYRSCFKLSDYEEIPTNWK